MSLIPVKKPKKCWSDSIEQAWQMAKVEIAGVVGSGIRGAPGMLEDQEGLAKDFSKKTPETPDSGYSSISSSSLASLG